MTKYINEAEKIYNTILGKSIPPSIETHFNNLSKIIESRYQEDELIKYRAYVEKVHDLEALEVAARHLKKLPLLTEKFKVMVYLAEISPENYSELINEDPGLFQAYFLLLYSLLCTGYKIAKGVIILSMSKL